MFQHNGIYMKKMAVRTRTTTTEMGIRRRCPPRYGRIGVCVCLQRRCCVTPAVQRLPARRCACHAITPRCCHVDAATPAVITIHCLTSFCRYKRLLARIAMSVMMMLKRRRAVSLRSQLIEWMPIDIAIVAAPMPRGEEHCRVLSCYARHEG